jgi:hypothetical protein
MTLSRGSRLSDEDAAALESLMLALFQWFGRKWL